MLDTIDILTAAVASPFAGAIPSALGAIAGGASTPLAVAAIVINPVVLAASAVITILGYSVYRARETRKGEIVSMAAARARRNR